MNISYEQNNEKNEVILNPHTCCGDHLKNK